MQTEPPMQNGVVRADPAKVRSLCKHLLGALTVWIADQPEEKIGLMDILMGCSGFHKIVAAHQIDTLHMDAGDAELFFNMVIQTLEASLQREHRRRFTPAQPGQPNQSPRKGKE